MGLFDKFSGGKKREAFYAEYAGSHGLKRSQDEIPVVTKNLDGELETKERFDGEIAPGVQGTVAMTETTIRTSATVVNSETDQMYSGLPEGSYTESTHTSVDAYPSTVVMIPLTGSAGTFSGLAVKGNYKKQSTGKRETYGELRRLPIEGLDLSDKFYVFADEDADPERVRQVFTSEFSAWLNGRLDAEKFFGFEVGGGTLVTKRPKHAKEAEQLDSYVAEASEIASRLNTAA